MEATGSSRLHSLPKVGHGFSVTRNWEPQFVAAYYWQPRIPEGATADLARIIEHYSAAWRKRRVLLVGYSFGADVLLADVRLAARF